MSGKRIVICADGTWNDPEDAHPTNVLRLARAVRAEDDTGVPQVVFYDWGVGSTYAKARGGVTGLGLLENVQDGYRFIVQNYDPDDAIFLFGFSRGAYTVRALAGMLNNCGVLTREHADRIPDAFAYYKKRSARPGSDAARRWRRRYGYGDDRGSVAFVGVWDTVGALGIPTRVLAFVNENDLFYDAEIGSNVEVARHAVSIDEKRADFAPTLWSPKDAVDVRQVWFAGVHADVGGGSAPRRGKRLSDVPLAWMAREASTAGLALEPHLHGSVRGLHTADAHRSYKRFWRVLGRRERAIPATGIVHASVKRRHEAIGYDPAPLRRWREANGGWGAIETE